MKKNNILGVILCLLVKTNLSAQEYNTYDLNKYYTPDIVRSGLDLNFNTSGDINNQINNFTNFSVNNDTINANNLWGQFDSYFFLYKNTRKNLEILNINLKLSGSFENYNSIPIKINNPNEHQESYSEYLSLSYSAKFYNSTQRFLSTGISTSISLSGNKYDIKDKNLVEISNTSNYLSSNFWPFIGVGIGRIESVKEARQALYILDDLSKRGVLTRNLSNDEIFKFAQRISQVKNKRFLDSRLRKIEEISTVDSFLVNNQLLIKSDAVYFTSLYDNWENGANFARNSGQVFEIKLSPTVDWNKIEYRSDVLNGSKTLNYKGNSIYRINLNFIYEYAKQINLKWEKGFSASLNSSAQRQISNYETNEIIEKIDSTNIGNITLNGNYHIGFYPNTRTYLSVNLGQSLDQIFYKYITNNGWSNSFYSTTKINSSVVYYVSPQLSITGSVSIYNNYSNFVYTNNLNTRNALRAGFSATLKYSLF